MRDDFVWRADAEAVEAGYRPSYVDLGHLAGDEALLAARRRMLTADLDLWMLMRRREPDFDGTIGALVAIYTTHERSPLRKLRPSTIRTYRTVAAAVRSLVGSRWLDSVTGLDVMTWSDDWSGGGARRARAMQMRNVLVCAAQFGVALRLAGAAELLSVIRATKRTFARPRPRSTVISTKEVVRLRAAAHAHGAPARALAYALVFETTLRLFDVIGQWSPEGAGSSDALGGAMTWNGLRWSDIDDDLVLRVVPTKTAGTTARSIAFPLALAPMVMEELAHWNDRRGPVIVASRTGRPYKHGGFRDGWLKDRQAAGVARGAWARDLRASGITEGRAAGASLDDAARVAGHSSSRITGAVYDRAQIEAAVRFAEARRAFRAN